MFVNGNQLAEILALTKGRVSQFKTAGMPCGPDGRYHLPTVVPWLVDRALKRGDVGESDSTRQIYYEALGQKARLDVEEKLASVYGREETIAFFHGLLAEFTKAFADLPDRLDAVAPNRGMAAAVHHELDEALATARDAIAEFTALPDKL